MLGDGSLGGGSELRRLKSSLFRARGAGQSLSILKGPITQTPRQGRPRAAWTDGRDVSAATARGRCLPRLAWAQLGARPRWFGTEWTELVAHAKRYADHLRLACDFIFGMLRYSAARSCPASSFAAGRMAGPQAGDKLGRPDTSSSFRRRGAPPSIAFCPTNQLLFATRSWSSLRIVFLITFINLWTIPQPGGLPCSLARNVSSSSSSSAV